MATEICRCAGIHFEEVVIRVTSENPELPNRRASRSRVGKYCLHQLATGAAVASCCVSESYVFLSVFILVEWSSDCRAFEYRCEARAVSHKMVAVPNVCCSRHSTPGKARVLCLRG